jgi:hypothetical protein
VVRVYAQRVSTEMIQYESRRDRPTEQFICEAMSTVIATITPEYAIAILATTSVTSAGAGPQPT